MALLLLLKGRMLSIREMEKTNGVPAGLDTQTPLLSGREAGMGWTGIRGAALPGKGLEGSLYLPRELHG